ncbi:MAG: TorF family putative porin [Betaproteobacteria bacterium]
MKLNISSSIVLSALLTATVVSNQAVAAEPENTLTFNIGATTDYRFRGISQSSFKPAVQGGADFSHKSGAYVGVWGSNVNWVKDFAGATDGSLEVDLYGGYKGELAMDLSFDVGIIGYIYPSNNAATNANTTEIYAALTYGVVTAKYSRSVTNFVANANSSGSQYLELAATFDLGNGFSVTPHIGRQMIPNQTTSGDYTDYSLTLGKDFGNGISASVSAVGTDAKDDFYKVGSVANLGKSGLFAGLKYSF